MPVLMLKVARGGGEEPLQLALPTERVREVAALGVLTPVPTAPPAIAGVTQLRGQILPVIHAVPGPPPLPGDALVVVEDGQWRAGIVAEVVGVESDGGKAQEIDLLALFNSITAAMTTGA